MKNTSQSQMTNNWIWFLRIRWFIFVSVYSAVFVFRCYRLPYLWGSWFRFMFTLVTHSFASLIDKQLSRKATLYCFSMCFCSNFPNEDHLIPFYFRQNLQVHKKLYYPRTAPGGGQYAFFRTSQQPISVRHDLKTSSVI